MANYRLTLLGAFELEVDGRTIVELGTAKAIAMLTYLALEARSDRTPLHRRQTLAALFWPEIGERYALQNLRNTLYRLRHTLQQVDSPQALPLMESTRQTISLDLRSLSVDVVELQTLVAKVSSHAHERLAACPPCVAHLEQVVALYRGELLAGFSLADAPAFEEWLLLRRELIHQQALLATSRLADIYEMQEMLDDALQVVLRLLELDPYREESHRQLMRIHARKHA